MKIDKITLVNFGSYEGETIFDTRTNSYKNIVLVGGKNGAGKTTLFTAIRLCLYGYMSMGYKSQNSFYTRAVIKLINNNAKMHKPVHASVAMQIAISNGQELDNYSISRSWMLSNSLSEKFNVKKNGILLTESELADFEKYILSLIPPELFNLYFFDGEKIADFFLEEGGNSRIKNAFLTLCGYDTFEIMRKNFKRIAKSNSKISNELEEYIQSKNQFESLQSQFTTLANELKDCCDQISNCDANIDLLEKTYYQEGGITEEEWNKKLFILKDEEKKRETYNSLLRKWVNEIVPFVMIKDEIEALLTQINSENSALKYKNFCEVLENEQIGKYINDPATILKIASNIYNTTDNTILDLSLEESSLLISQIKKILEFNSDKILKCKQSIKKSVSISAKTRDELNRSSTTNVKEYMKKRAEFFETKSFLLVKQVELEKEISEHKELLQQSETQLKKNRSRLEKSIKISSINDISAKAIVMIDKLQKVLYRKQIDKAEKFFREDIAILMRKVHFIDDIKIDDNFDVKIYKNETISGEKLLSIIKSNTKEQAIGLLGEKAIHTLMTKLNVNDISSMCKSLEINKDFEIIVPIEIDKTSLSNGEKQIFIMALYHSLIKLCKYEVPFIIDTPFARIDTEHRVNISKYFFSSLKGQIFILSTNEEIDSQHVAILKDKIASKYMLENTDNRKTTVLNNSYFIE